MTNTLSIKESLSFGWRTFKARPWFFVGASLIVLAVSLVSGSVQHGLIELLGSGPGGALAWIVALIVDTFMGMGIVALYLHAHDSLPSTRFTDLWHPHPFWRYLGAYLLYTLALLVGFILLVIPGFILMVMLGFSTFIVIDRELAPIAALKESVRITKGNRWRLFGLLAATLGINVLGFVALIIGLFVSVPVTILAVVHAYRTLTSPTLPLPEAHA